MVIVEQIADGPFNKGVIMNAAFKETAKLVVQELIKKNASYASTFCDLFAITVDRLLYVVIVVAVFPAVAFVAAAVVVGALVVLASVFPSLYFPIENVVRRER